jgi:putative NIF3 family GTP cyclohydrolase 1 type 2
MRCIFLFFILWGCFPQILIAQPILNAQEVIDGIKAALNCPWSEPTVDEFKAGNPQTKVKGIASTFMTTLEVLQKAHAMGCNLIITHEPTFYSHTDNLTLHASDEIQQQKLKFIEDHQLVIWRFHDHMHRHRPDMIYTGFLKKLGWNLQHLEDRHFIKIPSRSLAAVVKEIKQKTKARTMRVIGNPRQIITTVGLRLGAMGSAAHFEALREADCDLLIVGESNEWETVPFVQDEITWGKKRALIVLGHADSEEPGMIECRDWLQTLFPGLHVKFIEAGNPFWHGQ